MTVRCEDCKYWTLREVDFDQHDSVTQMRLGNCDRAMPYWDATEWQDVGDDCLRVVKPEFADRKFFAQDGSDYHAHVITAADFFCADHTTKPTTE